MTDITRKYEIDEKTLFFKKSYPKNVAVLKTEGTPQAREPSLLKAKQKKNGGEPFGEKIFFSKKSCSAEKLHYFLAMLMFQVCGPRYEMVLDTF